MSCNQCVYWDEDAAPLENYGQCRKAMFIGVSDTASVMITCGSRLLTRYDHYCKEEKNV